MEQKAFEELAEISRLLNNLEMSHTDVLTKKRDLVKRYIIAYQNVENWKELLALPETF